LASDKSKLQFVGKKAYENGQSELFEAEAHQVELIEFKSWPLYNGEAVAASYGWIWKIQKLNNGVESLETFCFFENQNGMVDFDTACGESLDAIEVSNETWILHIGTEDGEALNARAAKEDEFPARLENRTNFYQSITQLQKNGLITAIPELHKGERLHLQYLAAFDRKIEGKVNTWLAVEQDKRKLENWIGVDAKIRKR
jgi:hypothetical protein